MQDGLQAGCEPACPSVLPGPDRRRAPPDNRHDRGIDQGMDLPASHGECGYAPSLGAGGHGAGAH